MGFFQAWACFLCWRSPEICVSIWILVMHVGISVGICAWDRKTSHEFSIRVTWTALQGTLSGAGGEVLGLPWRRSQAGGFHSRRLFSHSSEGLKSKTKVRAGLVSFEVSLLDLQMATLVLLLHLVFSLLTWIPGVSLCALISSYKGTIQTGLGPR